MMSSPWPSLLLTAFYIYFVKYGGPQFMEKRKPFELRNVLFCYNFAMVILSGYTFIEVSEKKKVNWGFVDGRVLVRVLVQKEVQLNPRIWERTAWDKIYEGIRHASVCQDFFFFFFLRAASACVGSTVSE